MFEQQIELYHRLKFPLGNSRNRPPNIHMNFKIYVFFKPLVLFDIDREYSQDMYDMKKWTNPNFLDCHLLNLPFLNKILIIMIQFQIKINWKISNLLELIQIHIFV